MGALMSLTFNIWGLNALLVGVQCLNQRVLFLETANRPVTAPIQLMPHCPISASSDRGGKKEAVGPNNSALALVWNFQYCPAHSWWTSAVLLGYTYPSIHSLPTPPLPHLWERQRNQLHLKWLNKEILPRSKVARRELSARNVLEGGWQREDAEDGWNSLSSLFFPT